MITNDFFKILDLQSSPGAVKAVINIDRTHQIFNGHFPGQPVLPGVCMIQIVREISEKASLRKLRILSGENIKFSAIVNPNIESELKVDISFTKNLDIYFVQASLTNQSGACFKFKGSFQEV
jgi:3-hydroxyacyl-[acyl-carrier-protein] dehydratase